MPKGTTWSDKFESPATLKGRTAGIWPLLAAVIAVQFCGCSRPPESVRPSKKIPNADPWVLTCLDPLAPEPAYLSNGLMGLRIGRDGFGAPDHFFLAGAYTKDSTESLLALPSPLGGSMSGIGNGFFTRVSDYKQTLDMRTGLLHTQWRQPGLFFSTDTALDPMGPIMAQRWHVESDGPLPLPNGPDGFIAANSLQVRTHETFQSFHLANPKLPEYSFVVAVTVDSKGKALDYTRVVAISQQPVTSLPQWPPSFTAVAARSAKVWTARWKTDIVIDGPVEDQAAIHSWLFYLRSTIRSGQPASISPMGLSSSLYGGHVFWDADCWLFPALSLIDPEAAEAIPSFRLAHEPCPAPWECALTGQELAPKAFRASKHVTGDVAWLLDQAAALGLADAGSAWAYCRKAAAYYEQISTGPTKAREIKAVKGPDEYRKVDNDLYTNCLAQWLENRFGAMGYRYSLPHDSRGLISYDGDPVRDYGQADAILSIYPLQSKAAERQAQIILERLAPKINPSGPAMSDSIVALIWARLNKAQKGYEAWQESWRDYSGRPLLLFSELRSQDRTVFLTGAAGCLATVLYGFMGFRIDLQKDQEAVWAKRLNGEYWLSLSPHLPPQWKGVVLRNACVLGQRITFTITHNGTTVTQGEP